MALNFNDIEILGVLLRNGYLTAEEVKEAQEYAIDHRDTILSGLISKGMLSGNIISQAIAEDLKFPYVNLKSLQPKRDVIHKIPETIAREKRIILFEEGRKDISIASDEPANDLTEVLEELFPKKKVKMHFDMSSGIDEMLNLYNPSLQQLIDEIQETSEHIAPDILDKVFSNAVAEAVSDIHFEPTGTEVLIRFRIDGVLRDVVKISDEIYANVLNRIKVLSGIRLDLHAQTQDGSLQFKNGTTKIDLRTSIIPTVEGEKIVMRVLSSYVKGLGLSDIGFSLEHQRMMTESAKKPFGMIIVTGPTGSGKSTTLYSLLKLLNVEGVNITTIEDPVEYKMKGLNQIQVNSFVDLTFAKGLRSVVRQDPDIILVGEIRDQETVEIAVNASLTGHLLFSTFHTNDAATTVPRMLNMGIQPYLLASTLELVVAQRLVRTICKNCKHSHELDKEELEKKHPGFSMYFPDDKVILFKGKGCSQCGHSGFHGRTAIFEFLQITPEMESLIITSPSTQEIADLARTQGARSLFEDGIEKVKNGFTTIDELLRVAEPSDYEQEQMKE